MFSTSMSLEDRLRLKLKVISLCMAIMLDHPWQSLYTQYYRTVWFSSNFLHAVTFLHVLHLDVLWNWKLKFPYNAGPPMAIQYYVLHRVITSMSRGTVIYSENVSRCCTHSCVPLIHSKSECTIVAAASRHGSTFTLYWNSYSVATFYAVYTVLLPLSWNYNANICVTI